MISLYLKLSTYVLPEASGLLDSGFTAAGHLPDLAWCGAAYACLNLVLRTTQRLIRPCQPDESPGKHRPRGFPPQIIHNIQEELALAIRWFTGNTQSQELDLGIGLW